MTILKALVTQMGVTLEQLRAELLAGSEWDDPDEFKTQWIEDRLLSPIGRVLMIQDWNSKDGKEHGLDFRNRVYKFMRMTPNQILEQESAMIEMARIHAWDSSKEERLKDLEEVLKLPINTRHLISYYKMKQIDPTGILPDSFVQAFKEATAKPVKEKKEPAEKKSKKKKDSSVASEVASTLVQGQNINVPPVTPQAPTQAEPVVNNMTSTEAQATQSLMDEVLGQLL